MRVSWTFWLHTSVAARNYISLDDFNLLRVCDNPTSVVETVQQWYNNQEVAGKKALGRNNGAVSNQAQSHQDI
jgi:predicted Rossmann-fold nucleotide-binding protein